MAAEIIKRESDHGTVGPVASGRREAQLPLPALMQRTRPDEIPLSYAQERLWFLEQLGLTGPAYNLPIALRLQGRVDESALERSFVELVRRHESLRTRFEERDGVPYQVIDDPESFQLQRVEIEEGQVREWIQRERLQRFDLTRGPLFRVVLVRLGEAERVLLMTMHHIISDGWSMGVLLRELNALCAAYVRGERSPLSALPVQYADYALWQRQWLQGEVLEKQLSYWRKRLSGAPAVLQLPTDRARPAVASYRGGVVSFELSEDLTAGLQELSRQEGATLYMVLLAAFQVLLSRYSGQRDIVVGSPIAGRTHQQTEGLIGFFVNMLALRTDLSGEPSFRELLRRVKEVTLDAYAHQDLPFEKLVAELEPERVVAHQPIFQATFELREADLVDAESGLLNCTEIEFEESATTYEIAVRMAVRKSRIVAEVQCATELFDAATMESFARHFHTLLVLVRERSDQPISSISIVSAAEQAQRRTTKRFTHNYERWPRSEIHQSIPARFEAQAAKHPDNVAIAYRDSKPWTYRELNERASGIASWIVATRGSSAEAVLLDFSNEPLAIASMLAVLKAGKYYVPLDRDHPAQRLRSIAIDSAASVLLSSRDPSELVDRLRLTFDAVLDVTTAAPEDPRNAGCPQRSPESLAYLLYTSGSTGAPKAVMQNDVNVLHFMSCYTNALDISSRDRLSLIPSYTLDAGVMDIFGALLNGACVVISDFRSTGLVDILDEFERERISIWHSTPTVFRASMNTARRQAPRAIRIVVLGGEEARAGDLDLFKQRFDRGAVFVNGFGPTESTVATQFFADHTTVLTTDRMPIGVPVEHTNVVLLDESGEPADLVGEIAIHSRHVAPGYWKDEQRTARRFSMNPGDVGVRCYRTGDRGRWRADGMLEFMGRIDRQMKVRGYRVEPGEIEAALAKLPGVRQAAVVTRESDIDQQTQLIAYIESSVDGVDGADASKFLRELGDYLPGYMIPTAAVLLPRLPLLPNGKLDRRSLPALDISARLANRYVPPRTPLEESLCGIWVGTLGLNRVGIRDNFFELGGHSLLATRIVSRVRDLLQIELPVRAIFEAPTIEQLAEYLIDLLAD